MQSVSGCLQYRTLYVRALYTMVIVSSCTRTWTTTLLAHLHFEHPTFHSFRHTGQLLFTVLTTTDKSSYIPCLFRITLKLLVGISNSIYPSRVFHLPFAPSNPSSADKNLRDIVLPCTTLGARSMHKLCLGCTKHGVRPFRKTLPSD